MATSYTSGSIWDSVGGGRHIYATCSQTKGSSSENKSTINWTLTAAGAGSTCYDTGPTSLDIAGANRYWKARTSWSSFAFPAKAGSTSGSFTINHNVDGSIGGINVTVSSAIYTGTVSSTSGTWYMDSIARYFSSTPTISMTSKTETSENFSWSTSETCKKVVVYYKKSSESKYQNKAVYDNSTGAKSGTFSLTELSANTTYNVYIVATRKDSGLTSNSAAGDYKTYSYPYVSAITTSDLTIGGSQKVTIENPLGRKVTVYMSNTDKSTSSSVYIHAQETSGTSLTFTPNATTMYSKIPNAQSTTTYYYCYYGSTYVSSKSGTYKITGNEKPTFTADYITFKDSNTTVTDITGQTGNGGWLVQNQSTLQVKLATVAAPKNSATISSYSATIAGVSRTLGTSAGSTASWEKLNASTNQTLTVTVTDSRGLQTSITKTVTFKPYTPPSIALKGGRANNYGEIVDLTATFTSAAVEDRNKIKVSWSGAEKTGMFTKTDGTTAIDFITAFSGTGIAKITGIDNNTGYTFSATIEDQFGNSATASLQVPIGLPIMFIDTEQVGVGVNCLPESQGLYVKDNLRVGGKRQMQKFDMKLTGLSQSNFYPVIFQENHVMHCEIKSPSRKGDQPYNCNLIEFSCNGLGYNDVPHHLVVSSYGCFANNEISIGSIAEGNNGGAWCIWLRGGQDYDFYSDTVPTLYTSSYTSTTNEVYSVGTGYSGGSTNANITVRFTPQTTIVHGAFYSDAVKVGGTLTAGGLTVNGKSLLDRTYPVNSIYMSVSSTSPASLFGGTWEEIQGRFLLGRNSTWTNGSTGGSATACASHTHSIPALSGTAAGAGGHNHTCHLTTISGPNASYFRVSGSGNVDWGPTTWVGGFTNTVGNHTHSVTTSASTSGGASAAATNGNMPPYLAVYIWKRKS